MASYKLASYAGVEGPRAGLVIGEELFDAAQLTGRAADATVLGILDDWAAARDRLAESAARAPSGAGQPLAKVRLLAPILWPSAIYCAGANYADHAAEMARASGRAPEPDPHKLGAKPWHFLKAGHARGRRRHHQDFGRLEDHGLGDRACRRDRTRGQERPGRPRA